jgi:hypothetical protein
VFIKKFSEPENKDFRLNEKLPVIEIYWNSFGRDRCMLWL